ncbi:MAG: MFS transporter [Candidatus Andeanibacterium colombiense]|uniref:MFS transporter n=1 Tax=Candidatus Andeanibacterium colombiense TaxID=3121345 RepID=A0AAJ6BMX8_9SPHN|nr:MAG: MFS transporter [Sphingomonadaceae bacterium]
MLAALTITFMFNFLDRQVLALLVTPIKRDLHLSDTQVGLLMGFAFVAFYAIAGIPLSRLIDRGSRKWILGLGLGFWSLMTIACGLAQNFVQLVLARVGLGVGESCNTPATYSLVADLYPRERLSRAISVINLGNVGGQGLALLLGGTLILGLAHAPTGEWPLVGGLKPWQLTFLILGLPGVVWALVMLVTLPEPQRHREIGREYEAPALRDVARFAARWRWLYLALVLGITIKAMLSFGASIWGPSLFERQFGWATGKPGLYLGLVSLAVMPFGLLAGGWLADLLQARGRDDANAIVLLWSTVLLTPFAILFPLMPSAPLALAMQGASLFFGAMGTGPGNAAIQVITPGRMRGTVTAFYVAAMNVIGNGLGPLSVAILTDRVFASEAMLGKSMAISAAALGPLGVLLCWVALKIYPHAVAAARARET